LACPGTPKKIVSLAERGYMFNLFHTSLEAHITHMHIELLGKKGGRVVWTLEKARFSRTSVEAPPKPP
jgi:hypothetical protein